jgi:hypothetical protein
MSGKTFCVPLVLGYCCRVRPDPEIERLEADLRRSRFEKWDVENFLANRHRAKIAALTAPENKRAALWPVAKEISDMVFLYVGKAGTAAALCLWALGAF